MSLYIASPMDAVFVLAVRAQRVTGFVCQKGLQPKQDMRKQLLNT